MANLTLSDEEKKKFESQLEETIDYVNQLEEIDTQKVKPTSQVTGLENVVRKDEAAPSFSQEEALQNTKNKQNGMFKVPAILQE